MFPCVCLHRNWELAGAEARQMTTTIVYLHIYIKRKCFLKKNCVAFSTVMYTKNKQTKTLKGDASCTVFPVFFSLSENTFRFCLFTLDRRANKLTMCRSHWTWLLLRVRLRRVWVEHQAWDAWCPFEAVNRRNSFQAAGTEICPVLSFVWSPPSEVQAVESPHGWSCDVSPNGRN